MNQRLMHKGHVVGLVLLHRVTLEDTLDLRTKERPARNGNEFQQLVETQPPAELASMRQTASSHGAGRSR
jgi:hypothetical protein